MSTQNAQPLSIDARSLTNSNTFGSTAFRTYCSSCSTAWKPSGATSATDIRWDIRHLRTSQDRHPVRRGAGGGCDEYRCDLCYVRGAGAPDAAPSSRRSGADGHGTRGMDSWSLPLLWCANLKGTGDDPAITGEPPEERACQA